MSPQGLPPGRASARTWACLLWVARVCTGRAQLKTTPPICRARADHEFVVCAPAHVSPEADSSGRARRPAESQRVGAHLPRASAQVQSRAPSHVCMCTRKPTPGTPRRKICRAPAAPMIPVLPPAPGGRPRMPPRALLTPLVRPGHCHCRLTVGQALPLPAPWSLEDLVLLTAFPEPCPPPLPTSTPGSESSGSPSPAGAASADRPPT